MSTPTEQKAADKARDAASQARDVGQHAENAGKQVAQTAQQGAQEIMGDVRQQGAQLTREATQQLHGLAEEATTQLRDHATTQTDRAATQLRQLSDQARAFAEGRTDAAGPLPRYAQQATEKLSTIAQRLESGGADGALHDVRTFARRKPGTFLLLAGVAGFAAGRVLRGVKAAQDEQNAQPQTSSPLTRSAPTVYLDETQRTAF